MKFDISGFRIDAIELAVNHIDEYTTELTVYLKVPDVRDPSVQTTVFHRATYDSSFYISKPQIVVQVIVEALHHEVLEQLTIDGKQYRDPHAKPLIDRVNQ